METKTNTKAIVETLESRNAKNKEYMQELTDSNALTAFTAKNLSEAQKARNVELARLKSEAGDVDKSVYEREMVRALNKKEKTELNLI